MVPESVACARGVGRYSPADERTPPLEATASAAAVEDSLLALHAVRGAGLGRGHEVVTRSAIADEGGGHTWTVAFRSLPALAGSAPRVLVDGSGL